MPRGPNGERRSAGRGAPVTPREVIPALAGVTIVGIGLSLSMTLLARASRRGTVVLVLEPDHPIIGMSDDPKPGKRGPYKKTADEISK